MNFNETGHQQNLPRFAAVAAIHFALLSVIVGSINHKVFSSPESPTVVDLIPTAPPPKPKELPPPEPDFVPPKTQVYMPHVDIPIQPPVEPPPVITVITDPPPYQPPIDKPVLIAKKVDIIKPHQALHEKAVVDSRNCEKPEYPRNALRNGQEGVVELALLVGVDGRVVDAKIEKSSGSRELDNAAKQGLSLCRFKPAMTDGVPEQAWSKIEYAWKLD
ncbi:MAG: TonB family protein [Burkholderiales bacterium]|nr:TonB family protein [Burkholderiales bacterium]